jgi:chromosome segregation ATPase
MKLATKVTEIVNGGLKLYNGDYDYYKVEKAKEIISAIETDNNTEKKVSKQYAASDNEAKKLQKSHNQLMKKISDVEVRIEEIEFEFSNTQEKMLGLETDYEKLGLLQEEKSIIEINLAKEIEYWESLQEEIEILQGEIETLEGN